MGLRAIVGIDWSGGRLNPGDPIPSDFPQKLVASWIAQGLIGKTAPKKKAKRGGDR